MTKSAQLIKKKEKNMDFRDLQKEDPQIYEAIKGEKERQMGTLEMIASENFTSPAVMQAMGSYMTNKYAEGYPGKRYYGGCEYVDVAETLAISRAKSLFGAEFANVQPHAGAQANMAVYFAALQPGDTLLGMSLTNGGHLTHGAKVNFSGKLYNVVQYGLDKETELIDYDEVERLANEHKPKLIVAGASAYPRFIDFKRFKEIADAVGAKLMVDMAHIAGLVAAKLHPSPVPFADFVTSTTHKTLRGPRGGFVLCKEEYGKKINSAVFPGMQGGPLMHIIAGKAVCFKEAATQKFAEYQSQVLKNAKTLASVLKERGFRLITGGTDNHLLLVDLTNKKITGKEAEELLEKVGITINKNTIPNETLSPFVASGIRIGTPALTTRGFKESEMEIIGNIISKVIEKRNASTIEEAKKEVKEMASSFPLY